MKISEMILIFICIKKKKQKVELTPKQFSSRQMDLYADGFVYW